MLVLIIISVLSAVLVFPCFISASRSDIKLEKHFSKIKKKEINRDFFVKGCRVIVKH